jgi:hypothetical protein
MEEEFLKFIPWCKSWTERMVILDVTRGYTKDSAEILEKHRHELSDDLISVKNCVDVWDKPEIPLNVGEAGTWYRLVWFYHTKNNIKREIIKEGTLKSREVCIDSEIVDAKKWPPERLLTLDNGTTQVATAAYLMGDERRVADIKYYTPKYEKLHMTYEAPDYWKEKKKNNEMWEMRKDKTIERQVKAYLDYLAIGSMVFTPRHSEDYCFAKIFNSMTPEQEEAFTSVKSHESDRTKIGESIEEAEKFCTTSSKDHRIITNLVLKFAARKINLHVQHPENISKAWPKHQFDGLVNFIMKS